MEEENTKNAVTSMSGTSLRGLSAKYAYSARKTAYQGKIVHKSPSLRTVFHHQSWQFTWWDMTTTGARWRSSSMMTGSNLRVITTSAVRL